MWRIRGDRVGTVQLEDVLHPVAPARIAAHRTEQGYLRFKTRLARDGLLEYSDGESTWMEYRDRAELDAAARSLSALAVTDDHPPAMLDADNTREYARGWAVDGIAVESVDGVSWLTGEVVIYDRGLIDRIASGKTETSIGFRARVLPSKRRDAQYEQTQISLNHLAFVDDARSGPECRALLDGKVIVLPIRPLTAGRSDCRIHPGVSASRPQTASGGRRPAIALTSVKTAKADASRVIQLIRRSA